MEKEKEIGCRDVPYCVLVERAREQAVKEFAEKLKAEIRDLPKTALSFSVRQQAPEIIDLVFKELYGEDL